MFSGTGKDKVLKIDRIVRPDHELKGVWVTNPDCFCFSNRCRDTEDDSCFCDFISDDPNVKTQSRIKKSFCSKDLTGVTIKEVEFKEVEKKPYRRVNVRSRRVHVSKQESQQSQQSQSQKSQSQKSQQFQESQ